MSQCVAKMLLVLAVVGAMYACDDQPADSEQLEVEAIEDVLSEYASDTLLYAPEIDPLQLDSTVAPLSESSENFEEVTYDEDYVYYPDSAYSEYYDEEYDEYYGEEEYLEPEVLVLRAASSPPPNRDVVSDAAWEPIVRGHEYEIKQRDPVPERQEGWDFDDNLLEYLRIGAWVLVVGLLLLILLYFLRRGKADTTVDDVGKSLGVTDELLSASASELESSLDRDLRNGDYRGAIRYRFGQLLQRLRDAGHLQWVPGKTNEEYLLELPGATPSLQGMVGVASAFAKLAKSFDYATYGGRPVSQPQYESFHSGVAALEATL